MRVAINPGWARFQRFTFVPAVRAGNLLFVSGLTAADEEGRITSSSIVEQTEAIYRKLGQVLEAAGATFADVVQTTDYITTTEGYRETAAVRRQYFGGQYPAATGVIVAGLLNPAALIEVAAIAVLPGGEPAE